MPSVSVTSPTAAIRADAVVIGVRSTKDGARPAPGAEPVEAALGQRLAEALRALGAKGRPEEILKIPTLGLADYPLVVCAGLGDDPSDGEAARRAAGAALRALTGVRRVHLALDAPAGALAEGALLGAYAFTSYKSKPPKQELRTITLAAPASARAEVRRAAVVAEAVALTRDLVNTPPNDLYPQTFAEMNGRSSGASSAASSASARAASTRRAWCGSATGRPSPGRTWRWLARASPTTPAA
jgi:leucyl aminopeptidase